MNALFDAAWVARVTGGRILAGRGEVPFGGVSVDSRRIRPGDLFVALPGQRVDGHHYVGEALAGGANGALVREGAAIAGGVQAADQALIAVPDTLTALGDLAAAHRCRYNLPVVAVTGSVGKTSTKDMIASVLGRRWLTLATGGNYNNEIGLPLTLLQLGGGHGAAVLEMAMRGPGEIRRLAEIAAPAVGVLTNIGETHLERLGTVENIARAKAELLESLPPDGTAVLNGDDPRVRGVAGRSVAPVVYYGFEPGAAITGHDLDVDGEGRPRFTIITPRGRTRVSLPVPGRHNASNALAAAAVGTILGLDLDEIRAGLEGLSLTAMRMEIRHPANGLVILNDAYNASPVSTRAALRVLADLKVESGRRLAVLGNMLELGPYAEAGHREVGEAAAAMEPAALVLVGDLARLAGEAAIAGGLDPDRVHFCPSNARACAVLEDLVRPGDVILVKGSRGMAMEEIVRYLENWG